VPGARWADKIFRRNRDQAYERVDLEEAGEFELQDPSHFDDFGLGSARNSDDTEGASSSRAGKTPGWATPTLHPIGVEGSGSPAKRAPGYFAGHSNGYERRDDGLGVGSTVVSPGIASAMDMGGLVARTESRERLTPSLGRSRSGSPFRVGSRSPVVGFKDS
jgi:hypothetical protein